jgi:hypothetical protein
MKTLIFTFLLVFAAMTGIAPQSAQAEEMFYYWVAPWSGTHRSVPNESFVVQVDAGTAAQIDEINAKVINGTVFGAPGFSGHIAAGEADYNRDYFAPGHPLWNWHVVSVDSVFDLNTTSFPPCECPPLVANPSDIAADPEGWISTNGDVYTPVAYEIIGRIDPSKPDAVANVSNRAFTGADEKTAITGFIISGGLPRNVIVRALGPTLEAAEVQQFVANPKLEVHSSSATIAQNSDWQDDARASIISETFPTLAPNDEREAALFLTLLPGAYTILASSEDGAEGVVLTEVYDAEVSP